MGIMMGIISFLLGLCINLIDAAVSSMLDAIGYDMTTFLTVFPFAENAKDVFVALGLAFLAAGLVWNTAKGIAAPFGVEYENPLHVIGKTALTWFAVVNLMDILDLIIRFFQIALDYLNSLSLSTGNILDGFASRLVAAMMSSVSNIATGLNIIVYIIAIIVLGWKFIKLLVEMIERYIVFCFICLIGPSFVSTAAFKSTRDIAGTWFRAFFGQSFLILLNTFCVRAFLSFCIVFTANFAGLPVGGHYLSPLVMLFFGYAFLTFSSRVDTLLRILGLNTAHTGSSLLDGAISGITRFVAGAKSGVALGNALMQGRKAAAASGGLGTKQGFGAAVAATMSALGGKDRVAGASTINGNETNRRADGTKLHPDAPGRRANANTPFASGDLLRQEGSPAGRIMQGQKEIQDALLNKTNPDTSHGIGGTNGIKGLGHKMDFVDGGVMASSGQQNEYADKVHGSGKALGAIHQDSLTANAVRAAASSAELYKNSEGKWVPIASYKGSEAAAAMNGVLGFGNENLKGFLFTENEDGTSQISGMEFNDDSRITWDSVEGGIATGVYTDANGNSTAVQLIHDNAIASQKMQNPDAEQFDPAQAVGKVGDSSGTNGFYVVPLAASSSDDTTTPYGHNQTLGQMHATVDMKNEDQVKAARSNLSHFVDLCNPVDKQVKSISESRMDQMRSNAKTSTPRGGRKGKTGGKK